MPRVPSYAANRSRVLAVVEPDELGSGPDGPVAEVLVLVSSAEVDALVGRPPALASHGLWRLLAQARGRRAMEEALGEDRVPETALRAKVHRIGQCEFDEVRAVLAEEGRLRRDATDRDVFAEFAAVYLDARHLAPERLRAVFPGIRDLARVDAVLAADVDVARLLQATRPPGAADRDLGPRLAEAPPLEESAGASLGERAPGDERSRRMLERADRVSALGNVVRAAILRWRCAESEPPRFTDRRRAEARTELNKLARRLRAALDLDEARASDWRHTLYALLAPASRGPWPFEAQLLFDLQKVCVDHERNVYATRLLGWVASLGRRPLARLLPNQREVLMVRHLRSALARLGKTRLAQADRDRATGLLRDAIAQAEGRLRARFRPLIARTLERSEVSPANLPERVSLEASVEELLDRLVAFGLLTMQDLRDALSRGDVKLPDLSSPTELLAGDRLLKADRQMAISLDGVYRAGEVYLRLLQRASAVGFGTRVGRFLTRHVLLPFGGAYGALVALQEVVVICLEVAHYFSRLLRNHEEHGPLHGPELIDAGNVLVLGLFLYGLMHSAGFRTFVVTSVRLLFQPARAALIDLPHWVLRQPVIREVLLGRPFALALQYGVKPLLFGLAAVTVIRALGDRGSSLVVVGLVSTVVAAMLLGTRRVREAEEMLFDDAAHAWRHLIDDFFPGLFRWTMEFFTRVMEQTERLLYTVDEWLRFRSGQSRATLAAKALLGSVWAVVHYLARVFVNLLFEPTVNPIKHFPTVTVAAKLMIPAIPAISSVIVTPLEPLVGRLIAYGVSGAVLFFLPGIAGFLVWELKENWKLYEANRQRALRPRAIGSHGEDMLHLLKPGFHSGTVPKLFRQKRRALARPHADPRRAALLSQLGPRLHHVEEAVSYFIERHGLVMLRASQVWAGRAIALEHVVLATNRVQVSLIGPAGHEPVIVSFEHQSGRLIGSITRKGWLTGLDAPRRLAFEMALAGTYAKAGVQLVREWLDESLGGRVYDVSDEGLVVWPDPRSDERAIYDLDQRPRMMPRDPQGRMTASTPVLEAAEVRFDASPISWDAWVSAWDEGLESRSSPSGAWVAPRSLLSGDDAVP